MTGIWNIIEKVHFGVFWPNLGKTIIFPKNPDLSIFYLYRLPTSCKVSEKKIKRFTCNNHLKNPAIWLAESFKPKNSRTRIFLDMWMVLPDFLQYEAHFRIFSAKSNDWNLKYNWKGPFFGYFGPIWAKPEFSPKIRICHFFTFTDFQLHAKFQKKRSNGSPVITIWKILQSDWPRASSPKSWEPEFS